MNNYIITIGRGYGSGGRTIGKMLAKDLGIHYYDKEILKMASETSGINEQFFAGADEKLKNSNIFKIAQNVYRGENYDSEDNLVSNTKLFQHQAKVLTELAERESFVVIGRCADYVLRNYKNVLRVFVHASMQHCVENIGNMSSMSAYETEQFIRQTDNNRAQYYKFNTGKEWSDARNYDLCLNTDNLTWNDSVIMIKKCLEVKGIVRKFEKT